MLSPIPTPVFLTSSQVILMLWSRHPTLRTLLLFILAWLDHPCSDLN